VLAELGPFRLEIPTNFGPRILGLRFGGGPELFAQLSDDVGIERSDGGFYRFRGGHRLWAAPEIADVTYASEDRPCKVEADGKTVAVIGSTDEAGLAKEIHLAVDNQRLVVEHRLTNEGDRSMEVAPWAITQLPLGGVGKLPLGRGDGRGVQADRSLVLWPYTDPTDSRLSWEHDALTIAAIAHVPMKIGVGPDPGSLSYHRHGATFRKEFAGASQGQYPDRGAVAQVYVGEHFCELESVGALVVIEPGASTTHREIWSVHQL
jgi:hypothetical protein